jgi:hypothetical protein
VTGDLIAFLVARLDEDEAAAKAAQDRLSGRFAAGFTGTAGNPGSEEWRNRLRGLRAKGRYLDDDYRDYIARHDPARALRDIEADRKLLALYAEVADMDRDDPEPEYAYGRAVGLGEATRLRAARFSDHPDYRQEWAP